MFIGRANAPVENQTDCSPAACHRSDCRGHTESLRTGNTDNVVTPPRHQLVRAPPERYTAAVRRPWWYRVLIAVWGLWFTAALSEAGGLHSCPMHRRPRAPSHG